MANKVRKNITISERAQSRLKAIVEAQQHDSDSESIEAAIDLFGDVLTIVLNGDTARIGRKGRDIRVMMGKPTRSTLDRLSEETKEILDLDN